MGELRQIKPFLIYETRISRIYADEAWANVCRRAVLEKEHRPIPGESASRLAHSKTLARSPST